MAAPSREAGGRPAVGPTVGWLWAVIPFALLVWFLLQVPEIVAGNALSISRSWIPLLGFDFTLRIDGLSLLFAILISGVGVLIFGYAGHYLQGHPQLTRFYLYLTGFMVSMLGLVIADNLLVLFVFWELTSITSYLLIGFDHERKVARDSALQALLVTGGGGMALLVGFLLMGRVAGTFELSELASRAAVIEADPLYVPILLLVLLGAFTKSAQFPFHFWLPSAMEAPTPVSAYLHSATMVKAGVYLIARLAGVLSGREEWALLVMAAGVTTMVIGALLAFLVSDLKRILAYSTVSALGTLVLLLGVGSPAAVNAAMVFLLAHALYKAALFMIAGIIDHQTGTREVEMLGGLRKAMPITAALAIIGGISLAGFGPVLSFIGKEMMLETLTGDIRGRMLLTVAAVITAALLAGVAFMIVLRPFFGRRKETPLTPTEASIGLLAGPILLASMGVLFGLAPGVVGRTLIAPSSAAISGTMVELHLALWHGINLPLIISIVSVLIGLGLYSIWEHARTFSGHFRPLASISPAALYESSLRLVMNVARFQTRLLQSGYLRWYLLAVLFTVVTLVLLTLDRGVPLIVTDDWRDARFYEIVVAAMILLGAIFAIRSESRLASVASLGVVGYSVALMYIIFSAPDLAMTQFVIETLTVVLFVLVLYYLPRYSKLSSAGSRARDVVASTVVGILMAGLVLAVTHQSSTAEVSGFYAGAALEAGHGRNVVNVILVDFRALDTLGEITVLTVAAIGVFALLKLRIERSEP